MSLLSLLMHSWTSPSRGADEPAHRAALPGRAHALEAIVCRLLLGVLLVGAGPLARAQDDTETPPLEMLSEEALSNVLAVASEMLDGGTNQGAVLTNQPGTNGLVQQPVRPRESRVQKESRSQSNERDARRRPYRQSYDAVKSRDTFPGNAGSSTNAPARANSAPIRLDYSAFSIVADRNIFDPNRSPRRKASDGPAAKPKVVESFSLVGTMSYEKGSFAFFDGSSSSFRKALKAADSIGGCRVLEIGANSVKIASGTNTFELKVGAQLRREDEGEWQVSTQPASYVASSNGSAGASSSAASTLTSTSTPSSSSSASSSGAEGDVLKRMMQRREQE